MKPKPGDVCVIEDREAGGFTVLKVLAVDEAAVHIRFYDDSFRRPPRTVSTKKLDWSLGHVPLAREAFAELQARVLFNEPVSGEEREGYLIWKEAGGGAFD